MNPFKKQTPEEIVAEQMYEARRKHLEHQASADIHQALASAYKAQALRLANNATDSGAA